MEILQGTLDLLVLQTLSKMGPMHGWGIARRLEQISDDRMNLNYGTLYPALIRLEQRGWVTSTWGTSDNNRRAKFYSLTKQGRLRLTVERRTWREIASFVSRVLGES